jgi:hypothetical protein
MRRTERSWVATTCAPKRAFRIGVICAKRILVAKVMVNLLQRTRKLPQLGQITISCQFCADPPAPGISAPLLCNLTAQRHQTRILCIIESLSTVRKRSGFSLTIRKRNSKFPFLIAQKMAPSTQPFCLCCIFDIDISLDMRSKSF